MLMISIGSIRYTFGKLGGKTNGEKMKDFELKFEIELKNTRKGKRDVRI